MYFSRCSSQNGFGRGLIVLAVCIFFVFVLGMSLQFASFDLTKKEVQTTCARNQTKLQVQSDANNNIIYGHVHMAKTGGSSINGRLALKFERVCGNKGFSFKAFQANKKRDQTMPGTMMEWGFEDCDYISVETGFHSWPTWDKFWIPTIQYFASFNLTVELHVPCRDPLEHLMSMCNMHTSKRQFDCHASDLEREFSLCANKEWQDRFSMKMLNLTRVKCFDPIPPEPYLDYMAERLQTRRITHDYKFQSYNPKRSRSAECIWNNKTLQDAVLRLMRQKEYYKFCQDCLGSENDLLMLSNKNRVL